MAHSSIPWHWDSQPAVPHTHPKGSPSWGSATPLAAALALRQDQDGANHGNLPAPSHPHIALVPVGGCNLTQGPATDRH